MKKPLVLPVALTAILMLIAGGIAAVVLSVPPATASFVDQKGKGQDAPGEVDKAFPTEAITGNANGSGAPCRRGMADYFPCDNINLSSYLPMDEIGGGRGSDVWAWTDPQTQRRYVIAGRDNGTAFVDVTNERRPVYLGNLATSGTENVIWRDVKVHDNHAFIVSEAREHGMQVFDLTQLRDVDRNAAPVEFEATSMYEDFGRAHNIAINEDSGTAYALGVREDSHNCAGGLHMIDVNDPASPTFAGCYAGDDYTHDAQCVIYDGPDTAYTGREICLNSNEDTLTIVDVTDKSSPKQLSRVGYEGYAYSHQGWLTEDSKHFLMGDEIDEMTYGHGTRTWMWDVTDLDNPVQTAKHTADTAVIDHNLYLKGDLMFQSNYRAGLRILKVDDVENGKLTEVGYFDTWPQDDATEFSHGTWSNYPYFDNGVIVVHGYDGLFLLRPTGPARN